MSEKQVVIHKLRSADVRAVSRSMALAFFDDPVVGRWCTPDESRRAARLERLFELFLKRVYLRHDECYTTAELSGGAFWLPPGTWRLSALEQCHLVVRMARITGRSTWRILQVMNFIEARHPHRPHYYLPFIGVSPDWQGHGLGSALLQSILRRCDEDGVPAYLEASCERNYLLYLRQGFELTEKVALPDGGPPIWRMWREPR
jgi:GNAT superfamily N-acetyltransferase